MGNFDFSFIEKCASSISIVFDIVQGRLRVVDTRDILGEDGCVYRQLKGISELQDKGERDKMEREVTDLNTGIADGSLEVRTCKACKGLYLANASYNDQGVCQPCFNKMLANYRGINRNYQNKERDYGKDRYERRDRYQNRYENKGREKYKYRRFEPLLDENGERVYKTFFMQLNKEEREFLERLSKGLHETKHKIIFDALRDYADKKDVQEKIGSFVEVDL